MESTNLWEFINSNVLLLYSVLLTVIFIITINQYNKLKSKITNLDSNLRSNAVKQGLTLEQSQSKVAIDMREEIKKMVIKGMTDQEIKDYYVEKYGIYILADPPKTGFSIDPLKTISESIKKLKLSFLKVNLFVIKLISDFSESFRL